MVGFWWVAGGALAVVAVACVVIGARYPLESPLGAVIFGAGGLLLVPTLVCLGLAWWMGQRERSTGA